MSRRRVHDAHRPWKRIEQIEHITVIYAENRSFDHLYKLLPGAGGIAQAPADHKIQLDRDEAVAVSAVCMETRHTRSRPAISAPLAERAFPSRCRFETSCTAIITTKNKSPTAAASTAFAGTYPLAV